MSLLLCAFFVATTLVIFFIYGPKKMVDAALTDDVNAISWWNKIGINPNSNAFLVGTPLTCAAAAGKTNAVEKLLTLHTDINLLDGYGVAAIHCAVKHKREGVLLLLIRNKCNVNLLSRQGQTALDIAMEIENNEKNINILKKHGAKTSIEMIGAVKR